MSLKFGTAGVPLSAKDNSAEGGVIRIRELGLEAMEVEFVHGVRMREEKAAQVAVTALRENVHLTCHAPYYINLNSREEEKVKASKLRLLQTARIAKILGADSVIFHPAFYGGDSLDKVFAKVYQELAEVRSDLDKEGNTVLLRPETTGKPTQFGDLKEIIRLSREISGVLPCIDFSHLHARSNGICNGYDQFCYILEETAEALGDRWVNNAHFHISGIDYGPKGEKKHLVLAEGDFKYKELLKACRTFDVSGIVICESPNLEEDALLLQETYRKFLEE